MKFGENLRKLRKSKKLSQEKLAEKIGVSRQSVSKWECSESYPEMKHIIGLCQIFKCHINDLVHEDMSDIDCLDEEIKENTVKFKKEKQRKIRRLSHIVYLISRIGCIVCIFGFIMVIISMLVLLIAGTKTKIEDQYIRFDNHYYFYEVDQTNRIVIYDDHTKFSIKIDSTTDMKDYLENTSTAIIVLNGEIILLAIAITLGFVIQLLRLLEKLFMNIYCEDTPFLWENMQLIKKISFYIVIIAVFPYVSGMLFQFWSHIDMNIEFEIMNVVMALIVLTMAYVFEYGYEIQLDSQGKIYGDESV